MTDALTPTDQIGDHVADALEALRMSFAMAGAVLREGCGQAQEHLRGAAQQDDGRADFYDTALLLVTALKVAGAALETVAE